MRFTETQIQGVVEVTVDWHRDERGGFGRTFDADQFAAFGFGGSLQCSISTNTKRGTVRGFHLQNKPHEEVKLVQCAAGRLFDVALDLRPQSQTYGKHHAAEFSAETGRMLIIPQGCAHAFQTLEDETAILYYISTAYAPESANGVLWNDPALAVGWPIADAIVGERDRKLPRLADYRVPM